MTAPDEPVTRDAAALARSFLDAFNERDLETLRELTTDDVELRTLGGDELHGPGGEQALLEEAEQLGVRFVPFRDPRIEERGGRLIVRVPVRELVGPDDVERMAEFEIGDEHIGAFAIRPFDG
jgi:limonene-1,2-epoxide hydrolase